MRCFLNSISASKDPVGGGVAHVAHDLGPYLLAQTGQRPLRDRLGQGQRRIADLGSHGHGQLNRVATRGRWCQLGDTPPCLSPA